ncbi:dolichol kinase [Halorarius litoreus]|uniref:dolichol kinase n=1 Tax=Halorarius litoreus TaxID=2962676 RepID=UPI0020CE9690|nr:dolichol kinase [Halorarius litoreus]
MSELQRRLVHASGSVVPLAYVAGIATWPQVRVVAVAGTLLALGLEALRLLAGFDHPFYDRLTREYEQENLAGYALYAISGTVVMLLTPPEVGVPAVLMLTLGDPVSGLLSTGELRTVKRPRVLVGMFLTCLVLALPFVPPVAAVLGAVGATIADGVKPIIRGYVIDDNLTIPPAAAAGLLVGLRVVA